MTGGELSPKKEALYAAVVDFINEGADMNKLTVSEIASKAGIGKGTVYEYFDNKEELISSAILYNINICNQEILSRMNVIPEFRSKIYYLLEYLEADNENHICMINLIHYITGNSGAAQQIVEILKRESREYMIPKSIIDALFESARREGILNTKIPEIYLQFMLLSKAVSYGIYVIASKEEKEITNADMKGLICESICAEMRGEFKA